MQDDLSARMGALERTVRRQPMLLLRAGTGETSHYSALP